METQTKVIIGIPILLSGGTEIQTLKLVRALCGTGYHVTVLCYYEYESAMVEYMEDAGAEVVLMKLHRAHGLLSLFKKLVGKFKELSPEIVHVQYVAPGFVPIIAAKVAGVPKLIATVHQPGRTYGWQAGVILRTAARFCNLFFCVSKSVEESWFGNSELFDLKNMNTKRKHFTVYNAVDHDRIVECASTAKKRGLKAEMGLGNVPVLGVVGRLRREKGQDVLLEAMPEIVKVFPCAQLLIIGDGPDKKKLQQKAVLLGLSENIKWLEKKPADEMFSLLGIMDIAVVPSRFEGFGLSAAEAMAAGLPVVASKVDGLTEVVEDGLTGYLVPAGDKQKLASALIEVLYNLEKAKQMGERGQERVKMLFSIESFAKSMIEVYNFFTNR